MNHNFGDKGSVADQKHIVWLGSHILFMQHYGRFFCREEVPVIWILIFPVLWIHILYIEFGIWIRIQDVGLLAQFGSGSWVILSILKEKLKIIFEKKNSFKKSTVLLRLGWLVVN